MDLLGDIGQSDQLSSARAENAVLQAKVKELSGMVKELTVENQALKAEVEMYRREKEMMAAPNQEHKRSSSVNNKDHEDHDDDDDDDDFVRSGNGMHASEESVVVLDGLHGPSNPLCCALNPDDTLLVSGGADSVVSLCAWGAALAPTTGASKAVVRGASRISCPAPVICVAFARHGVRGGFGQRTKPQPIIAAGCMDGSVKLIEYSHNSLGGIRTKLLNPVFDKTKNNNNNDPMMKHGKYVKAVAWSPTSSLLATASADGTIMLTKVLPRTPPGMWDDDDDDLDENESKNPNDDVAVERVETFYLNATVETLCFADDGTTLCCYARETPHLSFFPLDDGGGDGGGGGDDDDDPRRRRKRQGQRTRKINLNSGGGRNVAGGFQDHVSFAVMDMSFSPRNDGSTYLALATDTSRNIVLDARTGRHVRNLYGHTNDGYSQPRIAWSQNGQYVYGNTQDDGSLRIWDVASSSVVRRFGDAHASPIRCLFGSRLTDTIVTTSFDKTTKVWTAAAAASSIY